jgi:hypothetical protein
MRCDSLYQSGTKLPPSCAAGSTRSATAWRLLNAENRREAWEAPPHYHKRGDKEGAIRCCGETRRLDNYMAGTGQVFADFDMRLAAALVAEYCISIHFWSLIIAHKF